MRKIFFLWGAVVIVFFLQSFVPRAVEKVRFRQYNWTDIGRSARSQNKMIFVLVTGDYCPTSNRMKRVFTDKRVAQFYNKNFVSTNFDAENFIQNYRVSNWGVSAVPAMVFLDKNRNVIHKAEGLFDAQGMIREAEIALEIKQNK